MINERKIRLKTPLGEDVLLLEHLRGSENLSGAFEYRVSALSPDGALDLSALLGQTATVEIELDEGGTRHFNGFVISFSHAGSSGAHARYELVLRPWFWLLSLNTNCRIFQNQTVPDIAKQIFREHGFTDFRESLSAAYRSWDYSVQYRESDFNYVSRLLEQEGIYYFFEHTDGKHTLVLADSSSAHRANPGYESIPYFPPAESHRRERDHFSGWTVARQMRPGTVASTDYDFKRPRASLLAQRKSPVGQPHGEFELFDYPGEYQTLEQADHHVQVRLEEHQADFHVAVATGNVLGLQAGALFKLRDFPRDDQNREHLVVSAFYDLRTSTYASGGEGGGNELHGTFTVIPANRPYRAPAQTPKPKVDGPQTATVVGKIGEEIWTDEHGRVKVQFHWDRYGKADEASSCWVRVSQLWAGSGWGGIHIPRIGQEVIIDFLEGDPDRPIVTGRVYNGDNKSPYGLPAQATQSGIKSRSSKGGTPGNFNEIRFEDKKGEEQVYIQAEKNQDILVKVDETHTVGHDRTKHVGNDETVTVGGYRTETVTKDESVAVLMNQSLDVTMNRTVTIGANHTETIAVAATETVGAAKVVSVGAAYQVTVGAAMTEAVGGAKQETIGGAKALTIGGASSEVISGAKSVSAETVLESARGTFTLTAGKDATLTTEKTLAASAGNDIHIKAGQKAIIEVGDELTLKAGAATIVLKKNGDIMIKGKNIVLDGKKVQQN